MRQLTGGARNERHHECRPSQPSGGLARNYHVADPLAVISYPHVSIDENVDKCGGGRQDLAALCLTTYLSLQRVRVRMPLPNALAGAASGPSVQRLVGKTSSASLGRREAVAPGNASVQSDQQLDYRPAGRPRTPAPLGVRGATSPARVAE